MTIDMLIGLFVALSVALSPGDYEVQVIDSTHVSYRVGNNYIISRGTTWCDQGYGIVKLPRNFSVEELVHELIHVVDCKDNGAFDGSPKPGALGPDPGHWYVDEVLTSGELF